MDNFFKLVDGVWVGTHYEPICFPDFWVDINQVNNERYYFPDLTSALDFYLEGWEKRLITIFESTTTEEGVRKLRPDYVPPLSHKGLYAHGHLIHGRSIFGDLPGHRERTCSQRWFERELNEG